MGAFAYRRAASGLVLATGVALGGWLAAATAARAAMDGGGGDSDAGSGLSSNGGVGPNGRTGGGRYELRGPYSYDSGYRRDERGLYQVGPTDAPYPGPARRR